jgi:tetratricopeptide (TPR) repeat protein
MAIETNMLSFLIDSYTKIGQQLTQQQEYDKAIKLYKKCLKVIWIEGET